MSSHHNRQVGRTYMLVIMTTGIALHYFILQINLWWVFHMATLFWKVHFPLQAKSFRSTKRLRVLHAICVVIGLFLPTLPVIATIAEDAVAARGSDQPRAGTIGFGFGIFPPILCSGMNVKVTFYSVIFPNVLLVYVGTTALILTVWRIHLVRINGCS